MLPPLFILFFLLLTQKETQEHFFSQEVMDKLRVSANTLTLKARNALFFLMGFFLIVALAGPVINEGEVEIKAKSADIMIALDISDSMLAEDVYPNRLKLAKKKALELLKSAPNERIGIIAFARNSYLVSPLSFDHGAVSFLLDKLNTDSITQKGTDFLAMLNVVKNSIDSKSKKYLLILSDGGDKSDFTQEIAFAKEQGIVVFVLGLGTPKGAPIKLKDGSFIKHKGDIIVSKLNENIAQLATSSGGVYIENSKSTEDVNAMLREIEAKSEEKELKSEKIHRFIPLFYYPVGMALLLLLIATSSMSKRSSVKLPTAFLLFGALFATPNVEAGLLDFVELNKAKKAYENAEYEKASAIYAKHAELSHNAQSYYNAGNSLYKQKKYKEAIESYQKARFDSDALRAKNAANIGNSYVKQGTPEDLKKAVESYEKSLKIKEDKETRENLNVVKKELQRQKKEQEKKDKQKKQDDKNKKDDKNKDEKKGDKKEDKKQDKESKDKKDKDDKSQDSKDEKSEDKEGQKSKDEQDKEDEGKKSDKKSNQSKEPKDAKDKESQSEKSDENNQTKEAEKPKLKEMKQEDANKSKEPAQKAPQTPSNAQMSNAEEAKWLGKLNKQQNSYMYMLDRQKPMKEDSNEKPW
jgi:Ca-activated chloride channel family protein